MSSPVIYLIDTPGLCYRAFYALGNLATSYGQPTGAVYGVINILNKILKDKPDYIACLWDVSRKTFRQEKFAEYKIQRPPMPDELSSQIGLIKELIAAYNITGFELEGYEADDLIASFTRQGKEQGLEVVIVSSDKDILQLVVENVKVLDPKKDKEEVFYDTKAIQAKYGIEPQRIKDMISLMGDATDNIPGVKGIGEKTAIALLREFGSTDDLLKNAEKIKKEQLRKSIQENTDNILLAYELATLRDDLDVKLDLEELKYREPDHDKLYGLFKKLEFKSLLKGITSPQSSSFQERIEALDGAVNKNTVLEDLARKKEFFLFFDKDSADNLYFSGGENIYSLGLDDLLLKKIIEDSSVKKRGHNLKDLKIALYQKDINIQGERFDVMLAAYVIEPANSSFSLQELAFQYLEERHPEKGLKPENALGIILKLAPLLKQKIEESSLGKLFYELEMPLSCCLAWMQLNGVCIDTKVLKELSEKLEKRLINLRSGIYELNNGEEFNLNSPKQLSVVLFERLKLPVVKKTKTGLSTDEEVLRKLADKHKLPLLLLEYRQLTKLKSTYIDALPDLLDTKTHRIHATFDQVGTETGRLSSNNPNLQNIPATGELAGLIRSAFIAPEGHVLVAADYSQIELRVLAHFSGDKALISAFENNLDIHTHTAAMIYNVDENVVSQEMRDIAKRINFGIVYGMSSFGLAKDLRIPAVQAQAFIDEYFLRYPGVKEFIDTQIKSAKALGYVTTLMGRRRSLPGINANNKSLSSFAERQAVNSPIQGTAADIIKEAMINIYALFSGGQLKAKMIMQIHDELVFEVLSGHLKETAELIKEKMEHAVKLKVPIRVNIKKGENWGQMVEIRN